MDDVARKGAPHVRARCSKSIELGNRLSNDGVCCIRRLVPEMAAVSLQRKLLSKLRSLSGDTSCSNQRKGFLIETTTGDIIEGEEGIKNKSQTLFEGIGTSDEYLNILSDDLISFLKQILDSNIEILKGNSWIRIKGYEESTKKHADIYYYKNSKSIKLKSNDLDDQVDIYTLWVALTDIPNSNFGRLLFSHGLHQFQGFNRTLDNLVLATI